MSVCSVKCNARRPCRCERRSSRSFAVRNRLGSLHAEPFFVAIEKDPGVDVGHFPYITVKTLALGNAVNVSQFDSVFSPTHFAMTLNVKMRFLLFSCSRLALTVKAGDT